MDLFEQRLLEKMDELIRTLKEVIPPKKKLTVLDYLYDLELKKTMTAYQGTVIIDDPCKPDEEK